MKLTDELKKNAIVYLRNGWKAKLLDNQKGAIRYAEVYGDYTESGSIYSHDIVKYVDAKGKIKTNIKYTPNQLASKKLNDLVFGF